MNKRPVYGPCWLFTGAVINSGYGHATINNKDILVHRAVYEILVGPIPAKHDLDHLCRVKLCYNPAHLEPVTRSENTKRGLAATVIRKRAAEKMYCPQGHERISENIYRDKRGFGSCIPCQRDRVRRFRSANA